MSIELTKDAEALVCVLYAEYLKRLKSGIQNPKDFSGTDEAAEYTKNKFSVVCMIVCIVEYVIIVIYGNISSERISILCIYTNIEFI